MVQLGIDLSDVDTKDEYSVMAPGIQCVQITSSEVKEAKDNPRHQYLKLVMEVMDGDYKGRKYFEILNLWNSNLETVRSAKKQLKRIQIACEIHGDLHDSSELHYKPFFVDFKVVAKTEGSGENRKPVDPPEYLNKIRKVLIPGDDAVSPGASPQPAVATPATQPARPLTGSVAPWSK